MRFRLISVYNIPSLRPIILWITFFITAFIITRRSGDQTAQSPTSSLDCPCEDKASGRLYELCYHQPMNTSNMGANFSCSHLTYLKDLGILDDTGFINLEKGDFPLPVMVTASSDNHWHEAKPMLASLRKYRPKQRLIFYDLGLTEDKVNLIKSSCNVEYRKFPFERYPAYVANLFEYRWKPLLIAEMLKEFGVIWYMDSSIAWKKANLDHVYDLVRCRSDKKVRSRRPNWTIPSTADRKERKMRNENQTQESDWDRDRWQVSVAKCDKFAFMLHGYAGHGIFPTTHARTYNYFPTDIDEMKKLKMFEANLMFAVRTKEVNEFVLKWLVLCALQEDCMSPPGTNIYCQFGEDRFVDPANCHRYDQSVVNVLLANANDYDRYLYTSEIIDFYKVDRDAFNVGDVDIGCDGASS